MNWTCTLWQAALAAVVAMAAIVTFGLPALSDDNDALALLNKVRIVVDQGQLFDPDQLEKTLDLKIRGYTDKERLARECAGLFGDSSSVGRTYDIENSWFKARAGRLPGHPSVNAAQQSGPTIRYDTYFTTRCHHSDRVRSDSSRLSFINLDQFTCVTPAMVEREFGGTLGWGSHGWASAGYSGPGNDRYLAYANFSFLFPLGPVCASHLSIEQEERLGYRQRRAYEKYRTCTDRAMSEFCARTPGLKPSESNRLDEYAMGVCGTELSFIQKEPWTGQPPPPLPERPQRDYSEGPCAGK